jgi:hypothetical protein
MFLRTIAFIIVLGAAMNGARADTWSPVGATISFIAGTTSTAMQLGWVGNAAQAPPVAIVCNSGASDAYVALGKSGTTISLRRPPEFGRVSGAIVAARGCRTFSVNGATTIAAITPSGSTPLSVQTGIGTPLGISGPTVTGLLPTSCAGLPPRSLYDNGGQYPEFCPDTTDALTWDGVPLTWDGINITGL